MDKIQYFDFLNNKREKLIFTKNFIQNFNILETKIIDKKNDLLDEIEDLLFIIQVFLYSTSSNEDFDVKDFTKSILVRNYIHVVLLFERIEKLKNDMMLIIQDNSEI